jgi:hypothetical protein
MEEGFFALAYKFHHRENWLMRLRCGKKRLTHIWAFYRIDEAGRQ